LTRHVNATIGHATSRGLVDWDDYLGVTFGPSEIGCNAFDDMAIWTGSVTNDGRQWVDVLRGDLTRRPSPLCQRVGAAVSNDLHRWRRVSDEPAVYPDSRWYRTLAIKPAPTKGPDIVRSSEAWRDPPVFRDPRREWLASADQRTRSPCGSE